MVCFQAVYIQGILDGMQGLLSVMTWCSDFASSPPASHNFLKDNFF